MNHAIGCVSRGDKLFKLLVLGSIFLGILNHLIDLFVGQSARCLDHDRLLFTGRLVFGRHVQDTVRIQIESYFDLRHAARRRRNITQVETAQRLILCSLLALALYDVNRNGSLIVISC